MPDVSSIGPKRPCRGPPATLHGVVFDIFGPQQSVELLGIELLRLIALSIKCLGMKRCRRSTNGSQAFHRESEGRWKCQVKRQVRFRALAPRASGHRAMSTIFRGEISPRPTCGRNCGWIGRSFSIPTISTPGSN